MTTKANKSKAKRLLGASSFLILCGLLSASPLSVLSAAERQRSINVSGEAEIQVAPDQIIISMAALNKEKTLDAAKKGNDGTVKSLINYFTETLKIEPKHVQTDYLSVNPVYYSCNRNDEREGRCDPLKIQYYNLEKGIQVRLVDLTQYEVVIAKALALGVNKISNVQFITTELRKHKDKARELATIAAKEKAQAVAGALDMTVGKPISISLNNVGWSYSGRRSSRAMTQNVMVDQAGGMGDGGSSLAVGQINVSASVNINFDMK